MRVSVVIPARNEDLTIGPVLEQLRETVARLPQYAFETMVVVDDEQDLTIPVAQSYGARVVINPQRRGKGNALYYGFRQASGDVLAIFDSDGSHDPRELDRFLVEIEHGAGMVIGSRVLGGSDDHDVIRLFGNALFTMLMSILFGTTLMDTLNGFKVFRKELVAGYTPRAKGFDVEIELVAKAIRSGCRIVEVRAHESRRAGGRMKSRAIRDGFAILRACLREGFKFRVWQLFHPSANGRRAESSKNAGPGCA